MRKYRLEREEREEAEIQRRESEDRARDMLTLGMARTKRLTAITITIK